MTPGAVMTLSDDDVIDSGDRAAMDDGEVLQHGAPQQLVAVGPRFLVDPYCMLQAPGAPPTREEMGLGIKRVIQVHSSSAFWLGDMILLGESLFGEEASQFVDQADLTESTVKNLTWVAKNVPPSNRALAQSWSHCQAVAALKVPVQKDWLLKSRENDWSVAKLKTEIAAASTTKKLAFWLVVKCATEVQSDKLAKQLEAEGLTVVQHSGIKKLPSAKKAAKVKKGEVTARKRRGRAKLSTSRRPPR